MPEDAWLEPVSRRRFLQAGAFVGVHAAVPAALQSIAGREAKKISLLEDVGFTGAAWGWQFTDGASVLASAGQGGLGAVHVKSESGEYARYLVLGPVAGATYTISGWVRTDGVVAAEDGAGAYFAASQFEFQGRPTEFTVDGKQATEIRYGNYVGTGGWRRFEQSVKCLPTTAWFEVVVGIYRGAGQAWFSGLTFVEGLVGAAFERLAAATDPHRRLRELCGVEFVSERYADLAYGKASVGTKGAGLWPAYDAAPSLVMKTVGARVLMADVEGHPVVTEHAYGKGRVIFSADPVELHGDARFHGYGHAFYQALVAELKVPMERVETQGKVHCFRVPSQDARRVTVLVNHGAERQEMTVGAVRLSLGSRMPGVVVSEGGAVQTVESSGDVFEGGEALVSSDLHAMTIAFGREALSVAARVLVLPMGTGQFTLHTRHPFVKPVLLMGEIVSGRWKQYAARPLTHGISFAVDAELSLSMLLVCDEADSTKTVAEMEVWMTAPWKLERER